MKRNKLLLLGWDAADWNLINPLIQQGKMPALKKILENGVHGNMATMSPAFSPMLWTTVATGKTPDKHGILDFIEVSPDRSAVRPVTCVSRKSRAIWNIFHHQEMKSNVVGWWPSFPAEPINGVVVSDKFQKVNKDEKERRKILKGAIHPEHLTKDLISFRLYQDEITEAHILPFIPKAATIDQENDKSLRTFSKILSENVSIHNAATRLMRTTEWDFMAVYYDLIDHFCHAFMKYHPPQLRGIPNERFEIYKDVVNSAYQFQDMMLERMLDLIDEETTVIIMSDHGYESGYRRILKIPKFHAAPAMEHRQFGMFVASGPNIKKNEKIYGLGLVDVAPTILHHFDLPIGKDMDGKVALEIFNEQKEIKFIESWENVEGDFGELDKEFYQNEKVDEETMNQLIELGYVEKPDEDIEVAILKTECNIQQNLAKVYIGKKEFNKAKEILLKLIDKPETVNTIPFYIDLLNISLTEDDHNKTEEYFNHLKANDPENKLNLDIIEAKILVNKGELQKAMKILEKVKALHPVADVWYEVGGIYRRMNKLHEAQFSFEQAIFFDPDNARYHKDLAEVQLRLNLYEDAAISALNAIELVKYFPEAHYLLGEALEKLGDVENSKLAYEMASKLVPKGHQKAEHALENLEVIKQKEIQNDKNSHVKWDNQIVIVSGLPRSGTSMMMQMLQKGGLDALTDEKRESDISNPKGYFEYEDVKSLHKKNDWLHLAQNKSLKVVAPLLKHLNQQQRYKVIFMNRDLEEVIKSQQKMMGKNPDVLPMKVYNNFVDMLNHIEVWKDRFPNVELIYVDYKDLLENPKENITKIKDFVAVDLDENLMEEAIDQTLYRNKKNA